MSNNHQSGFSPFMAALVGGAAGAAVVYFSDEKRRKKVMDKVGEILEEGEEKGSGLKDEMDRSIHRGRKNLAKKIRQVEQRIAKTE